MTTTVKLRHPVQWGDGMVAEITLRPPTYGNVIACGGPPYVPVVTSAGGYDVVDHDRLRPYYDLLVDHPGKYNLIASLSLHDGMAVQQALLGFFIDSPPETSVEPPTSSSST